MRHGLVRGLVAGAAGTVALNTTTYLDMAVRGRPSSSTPADATKKFADQLGVGLGEGDRAENRASGGGALLGLLTGVSTGAVYGLIRQVVPMPTPAAAVVLAVSAMVNANLPLWRMGITDPRTWGFTAWLSDVIPHLAYGASTAAAYDALD